MNLNEIEIKKTGLLFFDILNGYYHEAGEAAKQRKKPMVDNAVLLMKAARASGIPIYFAKGSHREDEGTSVLLLTDTNIPLKPWPGGVPTLVKPAAIEGQSGAEVIPELEPRPTDYHLPKHRWSAFYQTYLDLALRAAKIDTIIISGGSTDVGIAATVFAGRDMDYNMIVVRDACATNHDQRAHDILMDAVFPRMSRVRTTREVLNMIEEARNR
jgi:ureidoacrylate peracid hydrolase